MILPLDIQIKASKYAEVKLQPRSVETTVDVGDSQSSQATHRLVILDPSTNIKILIDTGSDVSIIPNSKRFVRHNLSKFQLLAANVSQIKMVLIH